MYLTSPKSTFLDGLSDKALWRMLAESTKTQRSGLTLQGLCILLLFGAMLGVNRGLGTDMLKLSGFGGGIYARIIGWRET